MSKKNNYLYTVILPIISIISVGFLLYYLRPVCREYLTNSDTDTDNNTGTDTSNNIVLSQIIKINSRIDNLNSQVRTNTDNITKLNKQLNDLMNQQNEVMKKQFNQPNLSAAT
tara:strand:- start:317 stop:655 length:339 start_codon:yes stop_codon:yes gene_type:complete